MKLKDVLAVLATALLAACAVATESPEKTTSVSEALGLCNNPNYRTDIKFESPTVANLFNGDSWAYTQKTVSTNCYGDFVGHIQSGYVNFSGRCPNNQTGFQLVCSEYGTTALILCNSPDGRYQLDWTYLPNGGGVWSIYEYCATCTQNNGYGTGCGASYNAVITNDSGGP